MSDVTLILRKMEQGDPRVAEELLALVYQELRKLAAAKMDRESEAMPLQPTALVHEAWLRLGGDQPPTWQNRAHFFGAAAEAMRRVLIADYSRAIALQPDNPAAYNNRGHIREGQGDLDGAIADYTRAIELDPQLATAFRNRGNAKRAKGDPFGAIDDIDRAAQLENEQQSQRR